MKPRRVWMVWVSLGSGDKDYGPYSTELEASKVAASLRDMKISAGVYSVADSIDDGTPIHDNVEDR